LAYDFFAEPDFEDDAAEALVAFATEPLRAGTAAFLEEDCGLAGALAPVCVFFAVVFFTAPSAGDRNTTAWTSQMTLAIVTSLKMNKRSQSNKRISAIQP